MPDVSQAEVGRRLYHVHREKRIEQAMKLMQQGTGADWKQLSETDIHLLSHLLQCTWNTIDQEVWDKIAFMNITIKDVRKILSYGEGVRPRHNPEPGQVDEIRKILLAIS
jgi:hypothetical protein